MLPKLYFVVLFLLASPDDAVSVISLGKYNIQSGSTTTSGISSGAIMATQLHVILSSRVVGAGIFAGVPYGCALGSVAESLTCMQTPNLVSMIGLYTRTNTYDLYNSIDSVQNLQKNKVYIFHGSSDSVVKPASGDNVEQFYNYYGATVLKENINSQHCQPTDNFGGPCAQLNTDNYINNCNYKGAYEMANYLYGGGLIKPQGNEGLLANLFEFDQKEFFEISTPAMSSMDDIGYVYEPTRCAAGALCKLHIAFHGCQQGRQLIGNTYVLNAGYLEVAELNDIIVLFPQVVTSALSNPQGCWDWWGYNKNLYDTRNGNQIVAVTRMMDRMST